MIQATQEKTSLYPDLTMYVYIWMQKGNMIAGYLSFTLFCGNSMFYSSAPKIEVPLGRS